MHDHRAFDALGHALVEEFDHVSMAVRDIGESLGLVGAMGGRYLNGGVETDKGFRWAQFALTDGTKLELIDPIDPEDKEHFLVRFLERRGEGLHHLTFRVASLSDAVAAAERAGYEVVDVDDAGNWKEAFIHPRTSHGVLIQLAEWELDDPPMSLEEFLETAGKP